MLRPLISSLLAIALTTLGPALAGDSGQQRDTFVQAERALRAGDMQRFEQLRRALRDYPLYPYLDYQALERRLDGATPSEVEAFLQAYGDTPLAGMLRSKWLDRLAARGQWTDYLAFYEPDGSTSRHCHQLHALIATGRQTEAMPSVDAVWLHGRSQPKACDPVFDAWIKSGYRTEELVWQRIEKAMEAGETGLARYLARSLPADGQPWVKRWIDLYRNPRGAAEGERFATPHPYRQVMLSQAVRRLARWDGSEALQLWQSISKRYPFTAEQVSRTEHYIVRNLVRTPGDEAYDFIRRVAVDDDLEVHDARIGAALLREDWPQVIRWIGALPEKERDDERWTYWLARALEANGEAGAADALYRKAAQERTYYGFLAADRAGVPYHLLHAATPADDAAVAAVARLPGIQRARELFALQRWTDGRREWRALTLGMDTPRLKAAAKLAQQEGWHDRAIFTLARTGFWDDLELRFPLEHADLVASNANAQGIDNAWVFAVMRQESAFMANARSHAGAMGLMQLMPATASQVARKVLKRRPPRRNELYNPDTNIALGSAYLKQIKEKLGDSAVLATAAYNAGPHRVERWLPERTLPADIWIELVPFDETRGYLRRVLAYTVIYEKRMGREPTRLSERLHPVPPEISMIGSMRTAARLDSAG